VGFAGTEVVHLAASLAIRRDVPLTERSKAALPVRKQGANKAVIFIQERAITTYHRSRGFQTVAES
jgi:hypothetical protein